MPLFNYVCENEECGHKIEVNAKKDPLVVECEKCNGDMTRDWTCNTCSFKITGFNSKNGYSGK